MTPNTIAAAPHRASLDFSRSVASVTMPATTMSAQRASAPRNRPELNFE
jgi:hypothetical protein